MKLLNLFNEEKDPFKGTVEEASSTKYKVWSEDDA